MFCSLCGGILCLLGRLGNLCWFRCRNCGMDCHRSADECDCDDE